MSIVCNHCVIGNVPHSDNVFGASMSPIIMLEIHTILFAVCFDNNALLCSSMRRSARSARSANTFQGY